MESPYALMQFIPKREQTSIGRPFPIPGSNEVQVSELRQDHRPEQADFAVVTIIHQSEQGQI